MIIRLDFRVNHMELSNELWKNRSQKQKQFSMLCQLITVCFDAQFGTLGDIGWVKRLRVHTVYSQQSNDFLSYGLYPMFHQTQYLTGAQGIFLQKWD